MGQKSSSLLQGSSIEEIKGCTHFHTDEIMEIYDQFCEEFPCGMVTYDEFVEIYSRKFDLDNGGKLLVDRIFDVFDSDNNGTINFKEFIVGMSITMKGDLAEKLVWTFQIYDKDKNGWISRKEAAAIITSILKMKGEEVGDVEKEVHKLFVALDKNVDNRLSEKEFVTGAMNINAIRDLIQ